MEKEKTPQEIIELAEKALDEGLLDKAEQLCTMASEQVPGDKRVKKIINTLKKARKKKKHIHVLIAGDSLSLPRPWYLKEFEPLYNPFLSTGYFDTYPVILEQNIKKRMKVEARVTNIADRAFKIISLTSRMPDVFIYYDPDVIIIQVGVTDCWLRGDNRDEQDVPIEKFESEYRKLLQYKKMACPNKLMITVGICPTIPALFKRGTRMPDVINQYNELLASIEDENVVFYDPAELHDPENPNKLLHLDGIHLSTNGHKIFAEKIGEIIKENYRKNP